MEMFHIALHENKNRYLNTTHFPWPLDLSWFFLQRKIFGRKIPLLASFKVTYRCNLTCRACPFHLRSGDEDAHISWNTAIVALESLRRLGTRMVVFDGGEPLLWRGGSHRLHDRQTTFSACGGDNQRHTPS
jgi:sulfatase maturation enzyme AslB (radical SAM superfamily)